MQPPFWLSLLLLLRPVAAATSEYSPLEVGFCDSNGDGFYHEQPEDQLERWQAPFDNGTHLVILWKNDRRVSGRNVSSYYVDVKTSVPVLNFFVGQFGGFPQDLCHPGGSKARDAVNLEGSPSSCVPWAYNAHYDLQRTAFEIPSALRQLAQWDVAVTVRGYGTHSPVGKPEEATPAQWWCHKYRSVRREGALDDDPPSLKAPRPQQLSQALTKPVRWAWAKLAKAASSSPNL